MYAQRKRDESGSEGEATPSTPKTDKEKKKKKKEKKLKLAEEASEATEEAAADGEAEVSSTGTDFKQVFRQFVPFFV